MNAQRRVIASVVAVVLLSPLSGCVPSALVRGVQRLQDVTSGSVGPVMQPQELELELELYDGGFFTMQKPVGWEVITAGAYGGFGYVIRDPQQPARQVFYLGEIVPFYLSEEQKRIDRAYMDAGGFAVPQVDMPVVSPLTPGELFRNFSGIASSQIGRAYMPQLPRLEGFEVVTEQPVTSLLPKGEAAVIRGRFMDGEVPCEGQFMATVTQFMPHMNGPGGGTGIAGMVVGIMAPASEFPQLQDDLLACVGSFQFAPEYVQAGLQQSRENFEGVMRAGQTLREASEIVSRGWEQRNKTDDILSQKWSDTTLGAERVYDPETGEVYHVSNGFFERYDLNRGGYEMNGLQQLPSDDHGLWTTPPLDGGRIH